MIRLEWVFFMQFIMGGIMIILLQNQIKMKKQLDEITGEVNNYITYITEDMMAEMQESDCEETSKSQNGSEKNKKRKMEEEAENRIIQAVLGEYFP